MVYLQEEKSKDDGREQQGFLAKKLLDTRCVMISGEIDQAMAQKICSQLLILQEMGSEPIKLFINSQGGHVEAGDTIHDMIRFVKPPVYVVGTGWVASAGVSIYLAADRDKRLSLPNTRYMIHQPLGGVRGQSVDIEIEAKEILKIRARINALIAKATGQPLEKVEKDTDRNFWMSAEEAVDYGIVGHVVESYGQMEQLIG